MPDSRFLRILNDLTTAREVSIVTGIAASGARELIAADGVTVVLRDQDQCVYADEDVMAPLWKGRRFPVRSCVSGWVMLHGEPVVVPDVYQDDRFPHEPYRATFVKSLAMVPVGAPDAVAALGAYWASEHHATPRELAVLTALADAMGLALTNARLFDELRESLAREREARLIAETAVTAKDEFLASIAHELRQPLQAILAAVRLMRARASREQGERCREVVERQVRHMNRLVEDLLEAARIVRGHIQLDRSAIDIRETVRRTIDAVTPLVTERGQILEVSVPDGTLPVQADDVRLQQVVMNLLSNAVKYTDPGGRITVTVAKHGSETIVSVSDTGRGIDPDLLPRVFDLFSRGTLDTAGFGLGLAVTRKLVELHGGRIEARSPGRGCGSEFTVYLPMATTTFTASRQSADAASVRTPVIKANLRDGDTFSDGDT